MKKYLTLFISALVAGCVSKPIAQIKHIETSYNPDTEARIRLYGQQNYTTNLYNENYKIKVGGMNGFSDAFNKLFKPLESKSIGIPNTSLIKSLEKSRSRLFSQLYFEEYVFPANQTYEISSHYISGDYKSSTTCNVKAKAYFKNNSDYEIFTDIDDRNCYIAVYKISNVNGQVISEKISLSEK